MRKSLFLMAIVGLVTAAGPLAAQESDRDLFREAERRFEAGDYELALDRYRSLERSFPVSQYLPDANYRIGVAFYQLGLLEEADAQLARVARRYRSTRYLGFVPFWRGLIAYDGGAFEESRSLFAEFLSGTGATDTRIAMQARLYSGLAALALGDESASIVELEALFALTDEPEAEGYPLALLLSLYAKNGEAEELFALAARIDADELAPEWRPHLTLYLAEANFASGELEDAIAGYRRSESAPAELATLAFQRLFQLAQDGLIDEEPDAVLRRAEQALAGRTDVLAEFWLRVGIDAFDAGEAAVAELYFRRIWDFRERESIPASVPLYLSRLLDRRGETVEAERILTEYLEINPEDAAEEEIRVLVGLGNLRVRLGEPERAIEPLERAVSLSTGTDLYPNAAYQYAFALHRVGESRRSVEVIDAAFAGGPTGGAQADLLRLRSIVLRDLGRDTEALQALFEYLPLRPADAFAAVEYANLLFSLGRNSRVLEEVPTILEELERREALSAAAEADLRYVLGLAQINAAAYAEAADQMVRVAALTSAEGGRGSLRQYARFYEGWAAYRAASYDQAIDAFVAVSGDPGFPRAAEAAYLAGWSGFFSGAYTDAATQLARVGTLPATAELIVSAEYLLGRVLAAQGRFQEAAGRFLAIAVDEPDSVLADDARFEYAEAQVSLGQTSAAAAGFAELVSLFPESPLAEPAAFRRAEVLFAAERFRDAQGAYFDYRTSFSSGEQMDAALFWGGVASFRLGEAAGAILLWERLASEFRQSPLRPEALRRAAEAHAERSSYREALNLYTEFRAAYPDEARAARVDREIDQLVLLLNGLTEREAELFVTIEESGGAASANGRQAILELSRLAIYQDTAAGTAGADVIPLLEQVVDAEASDAQSAAQALFLIAEYRNREEELTRAAELYLEAARLGSADRDLAALSIYRAATMYSTLGRSTEVAALVAQLEQQFPSSEWLEEARGLRGGSND